MKILKFFANLILLNAFIFLPVFSQSETFIQLPPGVKEDMLSADYWIKKIDEPNKVRMTTNEIFAWNNNVSQCYTYGENSFRVLSNIRTEDKVIYADYIRNNMQRRNPNLVYYKKDKQGNVVKVSEKDYKNYYNIMNYSPLGSFETDFSYAYNSSGKLIAQSYNKKQYLSRKAIFVRHGDIKLFPTDERFSLYKDYWWDDENQMTGVLMNEPAIVLWESSDKNWYLVRTAFQTGWTKKENIAFVSDKEFERYFDYPSPSHEDFITITENHFNVDSLRILDDNKTPVPELSMGTYLHIKKWNHPGLTKINDNRFPHSSYVAEIPVRKSDGNLGFRYVEIPYSVCKRGLVPFTQANTLKLLFKCVGDLYGWGGQENNRDCSQLSMEVFRCFGFTFGRNSVTQAAMPGKTIDFHDTTDEEVLNLLEDIPAGTVMYFKGHIFMFIGWDNQKPYFISASGSYLDKEKNEINANSVIINNSDLVRKSEKTWLEVITYAKLLEGELDDRFITLNPDWEFADLSVINSGHGILYKASENRKNITVALNAGHGTFTNNENVFSHPDKSEKSDGQKFSSAISKGNSLNNGFLEDDVNLKVIHLLKTKLLNKGYDVLMVRDYTNTSLDNVARTVISNNIADIHISVHFDYDNSSNGGIYFCSIPEDLKKFVHVEKHFEKSNFLGECLLQGLEDQGYKIKGNGKLPRDLVQNAYSTIPTCTIELGNQNSNTSFDNLNSRANGLLKGIENYFSIIKKDTAEELEINLDMEENIEEIEEGISENIEKVIAETIE